MNTILKVLIGSQAHGLARPDSDYDYRGVFVVPTEQILSLGSNPKNTNWQEGKVDDTSWELGHFLHLATKCNPTILEVFGAPIEESTAEGDNLRDLLPYTLNSKKVFDAFSGYSHNQWKKVYADKYGNDRGGQTKYAMAGVRVLMQGQHLFNTGEMLVDFRTEKFYLRILEKFRDDLEKDKLSPGFILDTLVRWRTAMFDAMEQRKKPFEQDLDRVNSYLLSIRKAHWQ